MRYQAIKGMHDILPADAPRWQFVEQTAREHFASYGYGELRTPIVEETALFVRGVGDDTDIVQKEMYTFTDKGEDSLTLRPEGTASVVRAAIENNLINTTQPNLKVYYMGPMYRRERPQKGRYRQFHQIGVENFGATTGQADAELIEMVFSFLKKVGLSSFALQINSLGTIDERKSYVSALSEFFQSRQEGLCADCQNRLVKNALRILDCKNPACITLSVGHPNILDSLNEDSRNHFEAVKNDLTLLNVPFSVNPKMVRGLDYYQRTVFEFVSDQLGAQATVAAGGRYNELVKDLGGPDIPGIGFALGVERLIMLIPQTLETNSNSRRLFFAYMGEAARAQVLTLIKEYRALGYACEMDTEGKGLKGQLKKADRFSAHFAIILGEDELAKGEAVVKNFASGGQVSVALNLLNDLISKG